MHNNAYVREVLDRHRPTVGVDGAQAYIQALRPSLADWAGGKLEHIEIVAGVATGTAIKGTTDLDLLLSLKPDTSEDFEDIHTTLFNKMAQLGLYPAKRKAGVAITIGDTTIDLIPAKKEDALSGDHNIWLHRGKSWTKTNFHKHIQYVSESGRQQEIQAVKIWCKQQELEFPSLFLELTTIRSLTGFSRNAPASNFVRVLEYIRDNIESIVVIDPSNVNNIVSNDLTLDEKRTLAMFADASLTASWNEVIW
jgi:hypothetical protein